MASDWQTVTQPAAVRVLLSARYQPVLRRLMLGEWAVADLARACGLPLNAAHHRVQTLVKQGLVAVTRTRPRRGRPVRLYRAAAEAFFVPYAATPAASPEALVAQREQDFTRRFDQALLALGQSLVRDEREIGVRLYREGHQVVQDLTPQAGHFDPAALLQPQQPAVALISEPLRLSREEAKTLQRELAELYGRYAGRPGPGSYLLRLHLMPAAGDPEDRSRL
ncbi:helix-turn-helix domain-containing protein [Deinococcus budaensis]|uniref:HTH iclR-type domain-containing protein n=1 Tax=Deinococcus budaensis TaxID=1665626 RepID=A0A7W8LPV5_9DEIO|nr:helix-turn-helix domain-containing protein [Deinococcus budaensis]MBB5234007.1 hypothetical protein [Deinococcus budaensis]